MNKNSYIRADSKVMNEHHFIGLFIVLFEYMFYHFVELYIVFALFSTGCC